MSGRGTTRRQVYQAKVEYLMSNHRYYFNGRFPIEVNIECPYCGTVGPGWLDCHNCGAPYYEWW